MPFRRGDVRHAPPQHAGQEPANRGRLRETPSAPGIPSGRPAAAGPPGNGRAICLFIPHLAIGGAELQLSLLVGELARAGFRPLVATFEARDEIAETMRRGGVAVHVLARKGRTGIGAIVELARLLRREHVVLLHAWLWVSNWRAAIGRVLSPRVPVILSIRSMEDDLRRIHEVLYRTVSPLVDAVIVNGRAVMERSARRTGIPVSRYHVVPNAVEFERLERESLEPAPDMPDWGDAPIVGYVGGLQARKRVRSLPRIALGVLERHPQARFLIVGDGEQRAPLLEECARLGVLERFHLTGARRSVGRYLIAMDALVHPSMNEGCCNAILEAEALGVPPVAYAVGGNPEIVRHESTGFLVPDDDEAALAERVAWLLSNPGQARQMGDRARQLVLDEFSVPVMTRRTIAVYESVLARARS